MGIAYLIIFLSCLCYGELKKHDFFSPAYILILLYSLLLFVNSFGFSRYQIPWSPTSIELFSGALGLFLAAVLIVRMHFNLNNAAAIDFSVIKENIDEEARSIDWKWFARWIYVAGGLFLFGFLDAYLRAKQLPMLASDPNNARLDFVLHSRIFVHAWLFGPPTLMLSFEYILLSRQQLKTKLPIIIVTALVGLTYLTLVTRADLFRFFFFALLLYHYSKRRVSARSFFLVGAIAMFIFLAFLLLRVRNPILIVIQSHSIKAHFPRGLEWLSAVYTYVINNFWNFDYAIRRYYEGTGYYPYSYGYETFKPILQLLFIDGSFAHCYGFDSGYNESVVAVKGLNTVIFPWYLFKDFGPFGLFASSFLYGIVTAYFYYNTIMRKPSLARIGIWAVIAGMVMFSFIIDFWTRWFPYMNMLLIWLAHRQKKPAVSTLTDYPPGYAFPRPEKS